MEADEENKIEVKAQKKGLTTKVYTWGMGKEGALGNNKLTEESIPFNVGIKDKLTQVSSGGFCTMVVTEKGEVYAWGASKNGRIGLMAKEEPVLKPTKLPMLKNVIQVACGNWHSLILTNDGLVSSTGHNKYGALGLGNFTDISVFSPIAALDKVKTISAGDGVSYFLTDKGLLLSSGHWKRNGIGLDKHVSKPTPIPELKDTQVTMVGAGFTHTGCTDSEGKLYTWGSGSFHQLGHGNKDDRLTPKQVMKLDGIRVVFFAGSRGEKNCHSGCIDAEGNAFTWGSGYKGKLGHEESWSHEDPADEPVPRKMLALKGVQFKSISCGGIHTLLMDVKGVVYSFGCGSNGRLGHPESDNFVYLYREGFPRALDTFKGEIAIDMSASYYHNVALTEI